MNYLFDTNILVHFIRRSPIAGKVIDELDPFGKINIPLISVVSYAEILSLVPIFNWGDQKKEQLKDLLNKLLVVPIEAKDIIEAYVEIETYSKGKMISRPLPAGQSAINMGKNDIWIAATAKITKSTVITTDKDFDHLDKVFIDLIKMIE
ncbi:MAG: type II toxin-antitoxin system VapC family toxin [Bacteroidota bacterium]